MTRRALSSPVSPLALALVACASSTNPPPPAEAGLIVGVHADDFGSLVGSIHVVVKKDDVVVHDETLAAATTPPPLPKEYAIRGAAGARVDVTAEGLPPGGGPPTVTRLAASRLVIDGATSAKKLLRVRLESRCVQLPPIGGAPGFGVSCNAPQTCIAGLCASNEVTEAALEDYESGWALAPPDICRPAKRGPPEVRLGTGQTDFANLEDGQVLRLEKGPQGGHHIWIAARMKNLRQSGSTTTITSRLLNDRDPEPVPPASFVFTFEQDEGSYCRIWGLRYQVDAGAADLRQAYRRFLGKPLEVTVEVKDSTGASARSTKTVQLADKLLCPDGTEACND